MATYEITSPTGEKFEITAPDTASEADVMAYAQRQFAEQKPTQRKTSADTYAGEDVKGMGAIKRGLGGAKHAWDRAALGLKGVFTDLTPEDKALLEQGKAFTDEGGLAAGVGEFAGDVAMTAAPALKLQRGLMAAGKVLPRALGAIAANPVAAAAGSGAAVGALTNPMDRSSGAIGGAIGGGLGEGVGQVLTKTLGGVASKGVTPEARELMAQGVDVPLWKGSTNKTLRNVAERAKALPVTGDIMKGQERKAIEQWNRQLIDKATPPLPVVNDAGRVLRWETQQVGKTGQEGIEALGERFNQAYDALYAGRSVPIDAGFGRELGEIAAAARNYTPGAADTVEGAIRRVNDTLLKGTETTTATSQILDASGKPFMSETAGRVGVSSANFKRALNDLDTSISTAWKKGDDEAAESLMQVRDAMHALREKGLPPEVAAELQGVNSAYANFKTLQRAAGTLGAAKQGGVVTPRQQLNAIRARDRTPDKSAFAMGKARGQQAAQSAESVLGSELPEIGPGTAEKMMLVSGLGLGWMAPSALAAAGLVTRPGQRFLQGGYGFQEAVRNNPQLLADMLRSAGVASGNE